MKILYGHAAVRYASLFILPDAANQGKSHWETEKAINKYQVEIPDSKSTFSYCERRLVLPKSVILFKGVLKMKNVHFKRILSLTFVIVLVAAIALFAGCGGKTDTATTTTPSTEVSQIKRTVLGEGEKSFIFTVTDSKNETTEYEIHTDKSTVGAALLELELIEGEDSEYGLYVKKVNKIALEEQTYWAFYIDGEYGMTGVDSTDIKEGSTYAFKIETY